MNWVPLRKAALFALFVLCFALPAHAFKCKWIEAKAAEASAKVDVQEDLLKPSAVRALLRWLWGDSVTLTDKEAQAAVDRLNHAISRGDLVRAKQIEVRLSIAAKETVLTVADLWFQVELSHARMELAELRTIILSRLIAEQKGNPRIDALEALREEEWLAFIGEATNFGTYYSAYEPQKKFLEMIRANPTCEGVCQTSTVELMKQIGVQDPRLQSLAAGIDLKFEEAMKKLGFTLPMEDRALFKKLIAPRPENATSTEVDLYSLESLAGRTHLSAVQTAAASDGQRRQGWHSFRRLFEANTVSAIVMLIADRTPALGTIIRKTPLYRYGMPKLRQAEMRSKFGYDVAVVYRNTEIDLPKKIAQLREIGTRGEPGDIVEFLAHQAEYVGFWVVLHEEIMKTEIKKYADLRPHFQKWEEKRNSGKIKYWSSNYRTSPIDTVIRLIIYGLISYGMVSAAF